jgi:hypothetical protein
MRNSWILGSLAAAALVSGAATATPITVGKSSLVIDVEFWGREQITSANPEPGGPDIISYGDPLQGTFRIDPAADHSVTAHPSRDLPTEPNAVRYAGIPGAEFVTTDRIVPVSGLGSDDSVTIGDNVRFFPDEPRKDWFQVSDRLTDTYPTTDDYRELFVSVTTPLDIIHGTGFDQAFDLVDPEENGGSGYGFFRTKIDGAVKFMDFIVDRLRVSNHLVCRP